jgi:hypothetical protein
MAPRLLRLALVACAGSMAAACAQPGIVRDAAVFTGLAAKPVEPAGFVKDARQKEGDYMAIGVAAPKREVKPRSIADAKKLEESLEAQRVTNEAAGASARAAASPAAPNPADAKPAAGAKPAGAKPANAKPADAKPADAPDN